MIEIATGHGRTIGVGDSAPEEYMECVAWRRGYPSCHRQFAAIRDNDALSEDQKLAAVLEEHSIVQYGERTTVSLTPPGELPLDTPGDGTIYISRGQKDGTVRPVALEPEISRSLLVRAFLHADAPED